MFFTYGAVRAQINSGDHLPSQFISYTTEVLTHLTLKIKIIFKLIHN